MDVQKLWVEGEDNEQNRAREIDFYHPFNPLTAGVAYIRVFNFY